MTTNTPLKPLRQLPDPYTTFFDYIESFPDSQSVALEVPDLLEKDDSPVAPPEGFLKSPSSSLYERRGQGVVDEKDRPGDWETNLVMGPIIKGPW